MSSPPFSPGQAALWRKATSLCPQVCWQYDHHLSLPSLEGLQCSLAANNKNTQDPLKEFFRGNLVSNSIQWRAENSIPEGIKAWKTNKPQSLTTKHAYRHWGQGGKGEVLQNKVVLLNPGIYSGEHIMEVWHNRKKQDLLYAAPWQPAAACQHPSDSSLRAAGGASHGFWLEAFLVDGTSAFPFPTTIVTASSWWAKTAWLTLPLFHESIQKSGCHTTFRRHHLGPHTQHN